GGAMPVEQGGARESGGWAESRNARGARRFLSASARVPARRRRRRQARTAVRTPTTGPPASMPDGWRQPVMVKNKLFATSALNGRDTAIRRDKVSWGAIR